MENVFWGKVIEGRRRGRDLGYPTANLRVSKKIEDGVYISNVGLGNRKYESVSFVGAAQTFGEKDVFLETYIFNYSGDLYGKWMSVRLLKRIRGNEKFENKELLVKQIELDILKARDYFNR